MSFSEIIRTINSSLDTPDFEAVYDFLRAPRQIGALIHSAESNRPALEGCVRELEERFPNVGFGNDTVKQNVGELVAAILKEYGYVVNRDIGCIPLKENAGANRFKNASVYQYERVES